MRQVLAYPVRVEFVHHRGHIDVDGSKFRLGQEINSNKVTCPDELIRQQTVDFH